MRTLLATWLLVRTTSRISSRKTGGTWQRLRQSRDQVDPQKEQVTECRVFWRQLIYKIKGKKCLPFPPCCKIIQARAQNLGLIVQFSAVSYSKVQLMVQITLIISADLLESKPVLYLYNKLTIEVSELVNLTRFGRLWLMCELLLSFLSTFRKNSIPLMLYSGIRLQCFSVSTRITCEGGE